MSNRSLNRRHYGVAACFLLAITLLALLYVHLARNHQVPDLRPWLLGQAVFQDHDSAPNAPEIHQELPVPASVRNDPIAAGSSSVPPNRLPERSLAKDVVVSTDDSKPLPEIFLPDTGVVETESSPEFVSDLNIVAEDSVFQQSESTDALDSFENATELASTPGRESEGRQVPRLDLDVTQEDLERLVRSGHLLVVLRAQNRRSRVRSLIAEPVGDSFRLRPLNDAELSSVSTRHIGQAATGLTQRVLESTESSLRSMNLEEAQVSLRFSAETDLRLEQRQWEALQQAGMAVQFDVGERVSTNGTLVDCGDYLELSISQVRRGAEVVTLSNRSNPCG